ncbi:mediator of DNA damage checkpoint protein 1 isoform X2 [Erinaceus europaeus]|uniref:Mediator of DNA damage checkpoint protein 1 n=1 Tax=Erinaceus europaeus TaxID=9365 RepID=A0ABM3X980_ERIEU|nr:mediator of DNA damage checkpoint protein 1 isoform X2 [Erinaceus europaeus]
MEDTQAINWDVEEEEQPEIPGEYFGCSLEPVGRLRIFSSTHGPETDFPLYLGKNVIGRMPECSVVLPFPSISKQHAVIEILSWSKAPILKDYGSLNGTQILRPPKVLSPGTSHRLRDQELILFGDLPCQYRRLSTPPSLVCRGPLIVEESPRVQGGTQSQGILLAEDSEEEVDSLLERCVAEGPRTTSSPLVTVVPESDEEGPSPAPGGPGPSFTFNLDSDTDEEESRPPAAGESSPATRRGATTETELCKAERVVTESQLLKDQCSVKERDSDIKLERDAKKEVIPKRSPPAGEDSDTDVDDESTSTEKPAEAHLNSDTKVEEKRSPKISAEVSVKEEEISHGADTKIPELPGSAHLQKGLPDSDTDVKDSKAPLMVPPGKSEIPMTTESSTDDKEEVSAALTVARLKESHAIPCKRNSEDRAKPVVLGQSYSSTGRDSNTDVEEKGLVEKRETVSKDHTTKTHSEKSQLSLGDSDIKKEEDTSTSGVSLESSQASATTVISANVEEDKHQVPGVRVNQTYVEAEGGPAKLPEVHIKEACTPPAGDFEIDAQEGTSLVPSTMTGIKKRELPAERDSETKCAASVLKAGTQNGSSVAQVEQDCLPILRENLANPGVDANPPEEPTNSQRERTHTHRERGRKLHADMTKDSGNNHDNSEDLDLQSTQYFLRESHSLEDAVDEPWEILATQPFCPRESEASETQAIADCLEPHGSCSLSRRAAPQDQHPDSPVQAEPLAIESKGLQTLEKDTGHLNCRMPPAKDDQDYPSVSLPPSVPEASGSLQNPLISQNQNHVAPQLPLSPCPPPLEPPIPITRQNGSQEAPEIPLSSELESFHPKVRPRKSSRKTSPPVSSLNLEPHLTAPTDQPVRSESKSQVIRGRARNRSSVKTPEPDVPFLEPQLSTSRGQPVNPKPISRVTRGRTHRSSINTPEPDVPSTSELQPSTSVEQLVICKPVSRVTRGRVHRSSVNTPEPGVSIAAELQSPAPIDQPISPEPVSQVSRGRTHRSSVKTPESVVPIASEIQPSTPTDQSVISGITQGRTHKSVKTPKPVNPTPCELQPSTSTDQLIIPEPTSRATRGRTHRSSVKTPQTCELTSPKLEPSTPTNQPVTPGAIAQRDQSKTLRSSKVSVPVPATPEFQSPEPTPQTNGSRRQKTTRKQTSLTVTISHETYPGPPEPKPRSLRNQKREAMREAKSSRTTSEPAFAQPPELPTHATQIPKVEAPGRSGSTPDSQSTAPQSHKRSSSTVHSPPLQKRLQRGEDHQKKDFINEDKEDTSERPGKKEDIVTSGPGKRKRDQAEEEPKAIPSRSRRRTKSTQDYTTPKVLFTGVVDVRGEKAVLALGGSLASSVEEASHLVTDRVRRTVKFLCALGRGIPILSLDWLHQSRKAGCFLPPDEYIVTDPEQEKNFGFSLRKALSRAREQKLLEGYEIHVTPGVQPPPPQMGEIISCCGGTVLPSMPRSYKPQRVVITCSQDFHRCSVPCRVGLPILSPEFLLTGVLKQEAKPEAFILSTMELSPT